MDIKFSIKRKIFISYSRDDSVHARMLYGHLKEFRDLHGDVFFDQERIRAGERWSDVIEENVNSADLFILLISPNFLNSKFCFEEEARYALQRYLNQQAKVFTVLISECKFENMVPPIVKGRITFGQLQAAGPFRTRDRRLEAIELSKNKNTAWTRIIERIYKEGYGIETGSSRIPGFVGQSTQTVANLQHDNAKQLRELIFRCDRAEQCDQLEEEIKRSSMCRPFLAVACCCDDDKPKQFLYRVERTLPPYLMRPPHLIAYRLPPDLLSEGKSNSWYSQRFLEKHLPMWRGQSPEDVAAKLAEDPTPKLCWSMLMTEDPQEAEGYHRQLSQFLAAWPDLPPDSPVLVLLFFKHSPSRRSAFASLACLPHSLANGGPQAIPNPLSVWATALPPLLPVKRREIDNWFNDYGENIAPLAPDGEALKKALFDYHDQMNGLPMARLIDLVEKHVGIRTEIT